MLTDKNKKFFIADIYEQEFIDLDTDISHSDYILFIQEITKCQCPFPMKKLPIRHQITPLTLKEIQEALTQMQTPNSTDFEQGETI